MRFFDSHNHLQDKRLYSLFDAVFSLAEGAGIAGMTVNGTRPEDWSAVREVCSRCGSCHPAYGVHPWFVDALPPDWREILFSFLDSSPRSSIGEIGLDRWKTSENFSLQKEVFLWQLAQAAKRNLPVSIHCLRAWGEMMEVLRTEKLPERGFLLHAYGGPVDFVSELESLGAYFSFNGNFLGRPRKMPPFLLVSPDRLLVETDAPDMRPPPVFRSLSQVLDCQGQELNHPANLPFVYAELAKQRRVSLSEMAEGIEENFNRFFCG